jgi:PAS domain S-box-containing protein
MATDSKTNKHYTILLVEDQAILALSQKNILERRGFYVIIAVSGEKAIEVARDRQDIDLILMDIDLGSGIDGTEAAREILTFRDLPVVFLSSHTDHELVERTETLTSYGYIVKNSGETVLIASIKMAFRLFESRQQEIAAQKSLTESQHQIDYIINHDLKNMKEAVDRSEHRFKTIMDSIQDVVFTLDLDHRHTGVYGPWVRQAGLTPLFFLGKSFKEIYGPKDAQVHEQACDKTLKGDYTLYEWSIPTPHGRRYYQTSLSPIFDQQGQVVELVGIGRDITNLVEATDSLSVRIIEASESRSLSASHDHHRPDRFNENTGISDNQLGSNLGSADSASFLPSTGSFTSMYSIGTERGLTKGSKFFTFRWKIGGDWPAIYVSPTIQSFLGYTDKEFYSGRVLYKQIIHPDDRTRVTQEVDKYLTKGIEEFTQEYRLVTKDAKMLWVIDHTWIHRDSFGNPEYLQGMLTDSTYTKQQEIDLIRSEARFRGILDSVASLAVQGYDRNGNVKYWNKASESLYGYSKEEALGKNLLDLIIPKEIYSLVKQEIATMMQTGSPIPAGEIELRRKDGTRIQVFSSHVVVNLHAGEPEFYCLDLDLAEQKAAQATIEALLREKDLILKEAHHRIKNNMAVSINLLHLQAQIQEDRHLGLILDDAARRLQTMQILYDTLYDSDQVTEVQGKKFFFSLLSQILSTFGQGDMVSHQVVVDVNAIPLRIASPLGIILNELVTNSMKHGFKNVTSQETRRIEFSIQGQNINQKRLLLVEYRDNGTGIPPTIDFTHSSGFGMELIGRLVDQMNGIASIERTRGAHIKISVPR